PVRTLLHGAQRPRRDRALRDAAERSARLRGPRNAARRPRGANRLVRQIREERAAAGAGQWAVRGAFLFVALIAAVEGRAGCRCPASAWSSNLLVTTPADGREGFVACGYEDSRHGMVVRASEFQVFRCDPPEVLLALSA